MSQSKTRDSKIKTGLLLNWPQLKRISNEKLTTGRISDNVGARRVDDNSDVGVLDPFSIHKDFSSLIAAE